MQRAKPLSGIRILDLTRLLPGPVAALHLADLGADVIKMEDPQVGDYARTLGKGQGEDSAYFRMINRNKRGLRLDLKKPEGVEVFMALARDADVVMESFRPGVADKLGIGYEAVRGVNPRIAYCSISGYGQDGPYRHLAGHDLNYLGYAGMLDQIGPAGGDPVIPNFQIADLLGGALTAAMGVLAAVVEAQRTGQGRHVDVSMTESVLAHAYFSMLRLNDAGTSAPRGTDMLSGGLPCYSVYRTADGRHMAVAALEAKFWQTFCQVIGRPDLVARHAVTGAAAEAVKADLAALFATRSRDEWTALFAEADCCVTPVLSLEEALENEQTRARGTVFEAGGLRQFAPPMKLSEFDFTVDRPAPKVGEHSAQILAEAGFQPADIARFRDAGVI